jgi:hypothetical protein
MYRRGKLCYRDEAKPDAEIQKEIRHIIKQITASVTFLPLVYEPMVFNVLVYTSDNADVPEKEWLDTDPMAIEASMSQQVSSHTLAVQPILTIYRSNYARLAPTITGSGLWWTTVMKAELKNPPCLFVSVYLIY